MFPHVYSSIPQTDPPRPPSETLPTMYNLPSEDPEEPGLPDEFHGLQPQLLSRTLSLVGYSRSDYFTASDLNLYYDVKHPIWYKRPDWFLAVDVPRLYDGKDLRRSYVIWQEGQSPEIVVEFLSPGTEAEDLGRFYDESAKILDDSPTVRETVSQVPSDLDRQQKPPGKFEVYERRLRVPHYIVYSRYTQRLRYFKLMGALYREQLLNSQNPLIWIEDLEIGLGIWEGEFDEVPGHWLRWCNQAGEWLLTDTEQSQAAQAQAQLAKEQAQRAEAQAQVKLLQAAQNLLATGMSLEQVTSLLALSDEQIQAIRS